MTQIPYPRPVNEPDPPPAPAGPQGGYFPVVAARDRVMEPLCALELLVHLLQQPAAPADAPAMVAEIARGLGDVERLVGQVFDLLGLDAGMVTPRPSLIDVDALLAALVLDWRDRAAAAGAVLRTVPCRVTVRSDPDLLRRILGEFVGNALIHAAPRRVVVGGRRRGGHLRIEVHDDGTGIPEGTGAEIFEPLMRLGGGEDGAGAGLGLYIVKRLARLLGHEVGVDSAPHRGSVFWIAVPMVPLPGRLGH